MPSERARTAAAAAGGGRIDRPGSTTMTTTPKDPTVPENGKVGQDEQQRPQQQDQEQQQQQQQDQQVELLLDFTVSFPSAKLGLVLCQTTSSEAAPAVPGGIRVKSLAPSKYGIAAMALGVKVRDRLVSVAGKDVEGMAMAEVTDMLAEAGRPVQVTFCRAVKRGEVLPLGTRIFVPSADAWQLSEDGDLSDACSCSDAGSDAGSAAAPTIPPSSSPDRFEPLFKKPSASLAAEYNRRRRAVAQQARARRELGDARRQLEEARRRVAEAEERERGADRAVGRATERARRAELREPCHWNEMLKRLGEFRARHGHANVPRIKAADRADADPKLVELSRWALSQRDAYGRHDRKRRLAPHRAAAMTELGFVWSKRSVTWEERFEELLEFKRQHGHCKVPTVRGKKGGRGGLSAWVSQQRSQYWGLKEGKKVPLSEFKARRLEQAGFNWGKKRDDWDDFYQRLLEFRERHGHCIVPSKYAEDPRLRSWVLNQRRYYHEVKDGKKIPSFTEERKEKLEAIGFCWRRHAKGKRGTKRKLDASEEEADGPPEIDDDEEEEEFD